MRKILLAGATVVVLGACAPTPESPTTAPEPSPSEPAATAVPEPSAEPVPPVPSPTPSPDFTLAPVPERTDGEVARMVITSGDVPTVDQAVGPAALGPDYTVHGQCVGAAGLELAVLDATQGGEGEAVSTLEIPCGQDSVNTFSTADERERSVQLSVTGHDGEGLEGWVVVTNGVG